VCILKEGNRAVRLAVDCRYVNLHTRNNAYPIPDLASIFQRVGRANFISVADCKAGYWQLPVAEEDRWLTAFICNGGLFQFARVPFGMKCSGSSFVRAIEQIMRTIREFVASFVDDLAVYSNKWRQHLTHLDRFCRQ